MKLPSSITLCEVGLRDGLQNEATLLTVHQKVVLLLGLIDAGFKVIEVGSFMHPKAVPQMANTDEIYKAIGEIPGVELRALIPNLRGITRAIDCGCKKVKLNVSVSRMHNLKNLNMTPEQSIAGFASCVEAAKENGIAISGSISMPFASPWEGRTPVEDVDAIIEAYLKVGISEISLSDASGMAVPNQVYDREPEYYIAGGLVFTPLTANFIYSAWRNPGNMPADLAINLGKPRSRPDEEIVIVSMVLADEVNLGYQNIRAIRVVSVNGEKIVSLRQLADLIDRQKDGFLTLVLQNDNKIVMNAAKVKEATPRVMFRYRIASDRSTNLTKPLVFKK